MELSFIVVHPQKYFVEVSHMYQYIFANVLFLSSLTFTFGKCHREIVQENNSMIDFISITTKIHCFALWVLTLYVYYFSQFGLHRFLYVLCRWLDEKAFLMSFMLVCGDGLICIRMN